VERIPLADINWLENPQDWVGPSRAVLGDVSITPISTQPTPTLPTTVVSRELSGDQNVTIVSAKRVLALDMSGSLAATVWALGLGDLLVGRDISTTFPGVENLPIVTDGSAVRTGAAMIRSVDQPDLV
jgi:iron complex transport system substrate-binding protein